MTIAQYDAWFTQLSRYARGLVRNEAEKMKKFIRGLMLGIKSWLVSFQLHLYIQAVKRASELERDMQENQKIQAGG